MRFSSTLPTLLPRCYKFASLPVLGFVYWRLHRRWVRSRGGAVPVRLHGFKALINRGNPYPFMAAEHPAFNAPYVELVRMAARALDRPVRIVDVGASIGDPVFLLMERCPECVSFVMCVEGDAEFHQLLIANMRQFSHVACVKAMLSSTLEEVPALVKHHPGTAAALGTHKVSAVPLDSLARHDVDVLKIDVDGFDGAVLAGATQLLAASKPAVIFEWHPGLIARAGQCADRAFEVLQGHGYTRFLWFTNRGEFSHFGPLSTEARQKHADYLKAVSSRRDDHFDVIAIHRDSPIEDLTLATMPHFHQRPA